MITPTINAAAAHLATELGDHLRINTMIIDGEGARAAMLLHDRMTSICNDYARGEVDSADDDMITALDILTNAHGPLVNLELFLAATHHIDNRTAMLPS